MKKTNCKRRCPKCMSEYVTKYNVENTDQLMQLMDIYLSEWQHRDSLLWKQIFTCFFATLIVMILPFADIAGFSLGNTVPQWIFPVVGLMMAVAFFVIGKAYAVRLTATGIAYSRLSDKLPKEFRRVKLEEINPHSIANVRMAYFIVYIMSALLFGLGILLLVISLR
ncbi:MAG: hypothetical protein E7594_02145 [Ruminococcaceae bacterium]|nr:hypothetical protein [Oscillospiraceae bacterium]